MTPVEYKVVNSSLTIDRRWHCAHYFPDYNKLLVNGGWNITGPLADTLLFNIESCKWEKVKLEGQAPSARRWHSCTPLGSAHQLLLFGG